MHCSETGYFPGALKFPASREIPRCWCVGSPLTRTAATTTLTTHLEKD